MPKALDSAELLAKIDALDQFTMPPRSRRKASAKGAGVAATKPHRPLLTYALVAAVVVWVGAGVWFYLGSESPPAAAPVAAAPAPAVALASPAAAPIVAEPPPVSEPAPPTEAVATPATSDSEAERRRAARQRKAAEERLERLVKQAKDEAAARDRAQQVQQAQQAESERLRLETRLAEERRASAARAPTQAPAGPRSPEDLCADASGFIARGFCINRACLQPAWQAHPTCVALRERQERPFPFSSGN